MQHTSRRAFPWNFLASALAHGLLVLLVFLSPHHRNPPADIVEMEIREVAPEPANPTKEIFDDRGKKIVDQDKLNDEIDENAQYLSSHNQKVLKQTVAQKHGEFQNQRSKGGGGAMGHLLPRFDVQQAVRNLEEREKSALQAEPTKNPPQASANAPGNSNAGGPESQTLDYIKELDPGLETMLSTKEFKYYTFFSRVRRQINQHWTPMVKTRVDQIYRQGRRIASSDDLVTRCLVTLDKNGRLIRVQIIGNSGIRELDEAALEAFRSAAPFPNPPQGMIDPDGTIKIRWDFILEA